VYITLIITSINVSISSFSIHSFILFIFYIYRHGKDKRSRRTKYLLEIQTHPPQKPGHFQIQSTTIALGVCNGDILPEGVNSGLQLLPLPWMNRLNQTEPATFSCLSFFSDVLFRDSVFLYFKAYIVYPIYKYTLHGRVGV
jgi:hypothetical protein